MPRERDKEEELWQLSLRFPACLQPHVPRRVPNTALLWAATKSSTET